MRSRTRWAGSRSPPCTTARSTPCCCRPCCASTSRSGRGEVSRPAPHAGPARGRLPARLLRGPRPPASACRRACARWACPKPASPTRPPRHARPLGRDQPTAGERSRVPGPAAGSDGGLTERIDSQPTGVSRSATSGQPRLRASGSSFGMYLFRSSDRIAGARRRSDPRVDRFSRHCSGPFSGQRSPTRGLARLVRPRQRHPGFRYSRPAVRPRPPVGAAAAVRVLPRAMARARRRGAPGGEEFSLSHQPWSGRGLRPARLPRTYSQRQLDRDPRHPRRRNWARRADATARSSRPRRH